MAFPKIYVNGHLAGQWDYGYTSFRIDATPYVNRNGRNVIAVRVDTTNHVTRWYPGAGIYRKVTLQVRRPIHIAHWGTYVTTSIHGKDGAKVAVHSTIENHTDKDTKLAVRFTIHGSDDAKLIAFGNHVTVPASGSADVEASTRLAHYERWDIDHSTLYTLETEVMPVSDFDREDVDHSQLIDRESATFGIREFEFTPNDGFHLNGRRVQAPRRLLAPRPRIARRRIQSPGGRAATGDHARYGRERGPHIAQSASAGIT